MSFWFGVCVKREIYDLGYEILSVEDGKVTFEERCRSYLSSQYRIANSTKILLKIGEFKAVTFTELFDKTKDLAWENFIPVEGKFLGDEGKFN